MALVQAIETASEDAAQEAPTGGVTVGLLIGFDNDAKPLVSFPGCEKSEGLAAQTTIPLRRADVGREVALLFESGRHNRPLIIGRLESVFSQEASADCANPVVEMDGRRFVFNAEKEIVLRCGEASITLTSSGKILIRGTYLLNRSSGVNRIKGGSVQIN